MKKLILIAVILVLSACNTSYIVPKIQQVDLAITDPESVLIHEGDVRCIEGQVIGKCEAIEMSEATWAKLQYRYKLYKGGFEAQQEIIRRYNERSK